MAKAQITFYMQFVILAIILVMLGFGLNSFFLKPSQGTGGREDLMAYYQDCAAMAEECTLIKLGTFGQGVEIGDTPDQIMPKIIDPMTQIFQACADKMPKTKLKQGGSKAKLSFNDQDTSSVINAPVNLVGVQTQDILTDFPIIEQVRYRYLRDLELFERSQVGKRPEDFSIDFLSELNGSVNIYEN